MNKILINELQQARDRTCLSVLYRVHSVCVDGNQYGVSLGKCKIIFGSRAVKYADECLEAVGLANNEKKMYQGEWYYFTKAWFLMEVYRARELMAAEEGRAEGRPDNVVMFPGTAE